MKKKYKYIHFEETFGGATVPSWYCYNTKHGDLLGLCQWEPYWKQFVFTQKSQGIVFSASCLDDISHFLKQLNAARAAKPQSEPQP